VNMWGDGQTYRKNVIHDLSNTKGNHNDAFQTWTGQNDGAEGNPITNLLVEQNVVRNVTGSNAHGIMVEGPGHHDWTIRNNLWHNIGDQTFIFNVSAYPGIARVSVSNNTFVSAGVNNTMEFNSTTTATLADNIFYNCPGDPVWIGSSASVTHDYNLTGGTTASLAEAHGKSGDPLFTNVSAGDLHLRSGSPAINAGDNGALITPIRTQDLDGNPTQGVVDIGAYEAQ